MPENGFNDGFINPSIISANSARPGLMNNQVTPPAGSIADNNFRTVDPNVFNSSGSGSGFLGALGNFLNPFSSLISGGISAVANYFGQKQQIKAEKEMAQEQRDWNEKMFERQNEINDANWQRETEYNTPANQVKRLMDAGLNPLAVGLDGNSGAGMVNAPQALGYDRASLGNMQNPIAAGFGSGIQAASLQKDIELKNAQIDKIHADTAGVGLDNTFKDLTMDARVQAESLHNALTSANVENAKQELHNKQQELKKLAAETDNEIEKKALIKAEASLDNALKAKTDQETKAILELLPYNKLLIQAQTSAQKAAAAASYAKAAIDKGLLDSGYVDKLVDQIAEQSKYYKEAKKNQEAMARLNKWKASLRDGTIFDTSENGLPKGKTQMFLEDVLANTFSFMAMFGEAVQPAASAVTGLAVGAAALSGRLAPNAPQPYTETSVPILYGEDGKAIAVSKGKSMH